MISETPVSAWCDKALRFKPNIYPQANNNCLPRNFFVAVAVGSRGSGKTYSVCKLLKQYETAGFDGRQEMRTILFSPTHDANPVFGSLKSLAEDDVISNYSDSKLLEVVESIKFERDETLLYQKHMAIFKKFQRGDIDDMSQPEIAILEKLDYERPQPCRYPNGVINFMVYDDLIGSSAFKAIGRSALTNLTLKNRHLGINILICTQSLKSIPRSIRTNTSLYILFRFANNKILDDLHQEVSSTVTYDAFKIIYDHCTDEAHDCLVIDFTADKASRFKKSFRTVVQLSQN